MLFLIIPPSFKWILPDILKASTLTFNRPSPMTRHYCCIKSRVTLSRPLSGFKLECRQASWKGPLMCVMRQIVTGWQPIYAGGTVNITQGEKEMKLLRPTADCGRCKTVTHTHTRLYSWCGNKTISCSHLVNERKIMSVAEWTSGNIWNNTHTSPNVPPYEGTSQLLLDLTVYRSERWKYNTVLKYAASVRNWYSPKTQPIDLGWGCVVRPREKWK